MINSQVRLGVLKIRVGETLSDVVGERLRWLKGITIAAPETLTGTCTVAVSLDNGVSFQTLYSGGIALEVPAGGAIAIDYVGWDELRIESDTAEAAERIFLINGVEEVR